MSTQRLRANLLPHQDPMHVSTPLQKHKPTSKSPCLRILTPKKGASYIPNTEKHIGAFHAEFRNTGLLSRHPRRLQATSFFRKSQERIPEPTEVYTELSCCRLSLSWTKRRGCGSSRNAGHHPQADFVGPEKNFLLVVIRHHSTLQVFPAPGRGATGAQAR